MTQNGPKMIQNGPKTSTVHKILNLKGIYTILSRISKCCKSRILVLIFWVKKLVGANFYAFCNYAFEQRDGTFYQPCFRLKVDFSQKQAMLVVGHRPGPLKVLVSAFP